MKRLFKYYLWFLLNLIYLFTYCYSDRYQGWDYVGLNCRNNENTPVDWWFIYKPPSDELPYYEFGRNFTFITPNSKGRWELSNKYITSSSMLQHTLAPIFRPTYNDYLAVAIYDTREENDDFVGSMTRGVLMADEMGGVWIDHTVPGLINMKKDRPSFPENESVNGHLFMCLTLDLDVVNQIASNLRRLDPKITYLKIPDKVEHLLPEWKFDQLLRSKNIEVERFVTRGTTLRVEIITKSPGNNRSLYKAFARSKKITLDVYGQTKNKFLTTVCGKNFSVRNIRSISLKFPDKVMYLNSMIDKMRFAVSTAAPWQIKGSGPAQYWTCMSNLDKEDTTGIGGDLVCVEDFKVWRAFDNLKVSEPIC